MNLYLYISLYIFSLYYTDSSSEKLPLKIPQQKGLVLSGDCHHLTDE